jgi:hypothetical protein
MRTDSTYIEALLQGENEFETLAVAALFNGSKHYVIFLAINYAIMKTLFTLLCVSLLMISGCQSDQDLDTAEPVTDNSISEDLPMFMTTMTHMEGGHNDDQIEAVFEMHLTQLRFGMDLADEYEAIITIESEKPFARANVVWDHNMMQEIVDRGHGVGTHCDIGGNELMDYEEFVAALKTNKDLVDDLVGEDNNKGCSGAGGPNDWVQGMVDAGFIYIDGLVGFHLLAFDLNDRLEDWSNKEIYGGAYHNSIPEDFLARLNFSQLIDTEDWMDDGEGIVLSNGEFGQLARIEEGGWENDCGASEKGCQLTLEDVDTWVAIVMEMDASRDHSKYAKLSLYFPVNHWDPKNEDVLRYFFSEMQRLQDEGIIQWATQLDAVEAYLNI